MISSLTNDASIFKFEILIEVAKEAYQDTLKEESVQNFSKQLACRARQYPPAAAADQPADLWPPFPHSGGWPLQKYT